MSINKKIVITGASSGLGSCLLKSFSKNYDIINISRSISVSDSNIKVNFNDLTTLTKKLQAYNMKHDLCILNAGTMSGINCAHNISYLDFLEALKVNVIANKIIIDWSILNGCKFFIGISSGAALKNYDGWLNYCVSKSAFRSMLLQYQKDMTDLNFKLISPGILNTNMNKKIREVDIDSYPDMRKFHQTSAVDPQKASELIYKNFVEYFKIDRLEIDLRNEGEW